MDFYTSSDETHDAIRDKLVLAIAEFLTKPFLDELRQKIC